MKLKRNLWCFLKLIRKKIFFCQSNQEFNLRLANLVDIFVTLNDLNLILHKNINRINDHDAIYTFVAKLGLDIVKFLKNASFSFGTKNCPQEKPK